MTLIEWLEYVRRNAILPGPSAAACAPARRSFALNEAFVLAERACLVGAPPPREDAEESVSSEFVPCSYADSGIGGTGSPGESRPFRVVDVPFERPPSAKRPFAFGADATRRMKRDAFAPIALGESGPPWRPVREGVVGVGGMKESCDELAVWGALRPSIFCLSGRFLERGLSDEWEASISDEGVWWK